MPPEQTLRAAVVQAGSLPFQTPATVDKAVRLVGEAAAQGAQLVVFPEAFIGGYPKGLGFGLVVGARDAAGREEFRLYLEAAIAVPGPETARLGQAAKEHRCWLVVGAIERELGTCYCTVLFFGADGALLGKHRKLMPTALERMIWGFGDGSTLTTVESPWGRIGSVICWENYMPMLRMAMYSKGVSLYCAPTADDRDTWLPTMQHVALEGRCFVLSACQFIRRKDFPATVRMSLGDGPDAVLMRGGSVIVSPFGRVVAGPDFSGETMLTADLDLREIGRGKFDFDVAGHYSRPDVFKLIVNESPNRPVAAAPADSRASRMGNLVFCGASGRTGSAATRELLGRGHRVTAIVRDPARATTLKATGVRVALGSLEDPAVLAAALRGADALFALLPEDPLAPDFHAPRRAITEALVGAVRSSGIPHVVLLSAIAASLPSGNGPAKDLHALENLLGETGTVLTTLRACWMQENVAAVLKPARAAGIYPNFMFSADAAFPTIASRDVGTFVADAIADVPRAETIDLLGPAYTARQMSQVLGKALGKPLRIVDIPTQAQVPMLMQAGLSQSFAEAVAELYTCFGTGRVKPRGERQLAGTTPLETTIAELLAAAG